jgi:hypothetical protein
MSEPEQDRQPEPPTGNRWVLTITAEAEVIPGAPNDEEGDPE